MAIKQPTKQQQDIIDYCGNIVVTAKPGSGKTYTLVEKIARIIPALPDYKGVVAISFTNKASDELKQRCKQKGIISTSSFFGTIDSFYLSQIVIPFASHLTGNLPEYDVIRSLEKHSSYASLLDVNESFSEKQETLLLDALKKGKIFLQILGQIALYILKTTPGAIKYLKSRFSHIIIDEYQDCGAPQHAVFLHLVEKGLVGIAVGDINQAIYGFTHRFPEYLISLMKRNDFCLFELSKNHRCHPSISEYSLCLFGASREVPEEKRVFLVHVYGNEANIAHKIDDYIEPIKNKYGIAHNNQIAILCRKKKTAQNISDELKTAHKFFEDTALDTDSSQWGRFFRDTLYARFEAGTFAVDYAEQLFSEDFDPLKYRVALKLCNGIFSCPLENIASIQNDFIRLAELAYPDKKDEYAVQSLNQILNDSRHLANYVPASRNEINLMTLHKSKGLEFNIVFHLDLYKWVMPHEYSSEVERLQDLNLHYVGITRAIDACYIVNGTSRYKTNNLCVSTETSPFLLRPGLVERRRDVYWK